MIISNELNVVYAVFENIIANILCDVFKHFWKILVIPAFWLLLRWLRRVGIRKIMHLVRIVLKKAKDLLNRIRGHDADEPKPKPPNKHERGKNMRSPPRRKKRRKRKMRERKHRK